MNVPAVKTDPMADFQAKLQQRVREDIRDLLPEDAVAKLVQQAVEKEFFQPRRVDEGYGRSSEAPSWFVQEVVKAATPIIRAAVDKCIADNPAAVEKAIADFLGPNRLTILTTDHLTGMLSSAIISLQEQMRMSR
jgi:hypothetical protein